MERRLDRALLTKREGRTGRISARGLDSTDRTKRGPYKKDQAVADLGEGPGGPGPPLILGEKRRHD